MSSDLHLRYLSDLVARGVQLAQRAEGLGGEMGRIPVAATPMDASRHADEALHLAVSGQIIMRVLSWLICAVGEARGEATPADMEDLLAPDWRNGGDDGIGTPFLALRHDADTLYREVLSFSRVIRWEKGRIPAAIPAFTGVTGQWMG